MKNPIQFYYITLLMLLTIATLSSCKKDKEVVAPDAATSVAGNYVYSELSYNGQTLPADQTNLKGSIKLTRLTDTQITFDVNLRSKSDNSEFIVENVEGVQVTNLGNGTYGLRYDDEEFAQVKGNKLNFKGVDEEGVNFIVMAIK